MAFLAIKRWPHLNRFQEIDGNLPVPTIGFHVQKLVLRCTISKKSVALASRHTCQIPHRLKFRARSNLVDNLPQQAASQPPRDNFRIAALGPQRFSISSNNEQTNQILILRHAMTVCDPPSETQATNLFIKARNVATTCTKRLPQEPQGRVSENCRPSRIYVREQVAQEPEHADHRKHDHKQQAP